MCIFFHFFLLFFFFFISFKDSLNFEIFSLVMRDIMAVAAIYMVDHKGGGGGFYMIDNNGK